MRRCPSCGESGVYVVPEARTPDHESSNGIEPLALTAHYGEDGSTGLFGVPQRRRQAVRLAARVCRSCGHVSWFVPDLSLLAHFADEGHGGVRREG